jgi:NAD(P)-dependent dehydrogenase (short-subunit alcohol dehydrogenase family)
MRLALSIAGKQGRKTRWMRALKHVSLAASIGREARIGMSDALGMAGKVVIVTGGTKGIGRAIAQRFLGAGAEVVICARKDPAHPVKAGDREAAFIAADVREPTEIDSVVTFTTKRFGKLDVLVNNAGGSPMADAATASPRFSTAIISLNLIAPLCFAQRANAVMQAQGEGGSIINIASVSGTRPSPGTAAYGAAKAGLLNLTQSLAVEWAPRVRVNAVTAGLIRTELSHLHYGDEKGIAAASATVPLGRLGEPEDVADACLFLASPLSRYVSGSNLLVHGGGERPAFLDAVKAATRA